MDAHPPDLLQHAHCGARRGSSTRMPGSACLTGQMLPQGWWQPPLTPHSTYDAGGLLNDLGDERFGQVSTCVFCAWFEGTRRLTLGITVDSNHGKARQGPFPKCQALARVSGAKLWALVQSMDQSQVSELGLESLPLVWEASAGLRAH